jgi:hypothetical protein
LNGTKYIAYKLLVGKPEGKRPLGRARHGWVDNIKVVLREIRWGDMDLIVLAPDMASALVNMAMNLQVP